MNCYAIKFTNGKYAGILYDEATDKLFVYPATIKAAYHMQLLSDARGMVEDIQAGRIVKKEDHLTVKTKELLVIDGIYKIEIKECEKVKEEI